MLQTYADLICNALITPDLRFWHIGPADRERTTSRGGSLGARSFEGWGGENQRGWAGPLLAPAHPLEDTLGRKTA